VLNRSRAEHMLASLQRYLATLRVLATTPRDEFLASGDKIGNA
jgi:hypothetical protein